MPNSAEPTKTTIYVTDAEMTDWVAKALAREGRLPQWVYGNAARIQLVLLSSGANVIINPVEKA